MVLSIANWIITIGGGIGLSRAEISIWWAFVPLGILLLIIAPYRLWKSQSNDLRKYTSKQLRVEVEKQPEITPKHIWCHLIVYNGSSEPIEGCYGQLLSITPIKNNVPYSAIRLPWSSYGATYTKTTTIPGKSYAYLDVVMTNYKNLYIVHLVPDPARRGTLYVGSPGTYEAEIQVGSEKEAFEPTRIKLIITLDEDGNLHAKKQV